MSDRDRITTGVWTRRAKRRAWVCGVGAFLFSAGSFAVIAPQTHGFPHRHGLSGWIGAKLFRGARANVSRWSSSWVVVRTPRGFEDFGDEVETIGRDALSASMNGADNAWLVQVRESGWNEGFWAATSIHNASSAEVLFWTRTPQARQEGSITGDELAAIRRIAVKGVDQARFLEYPHGIPHLIAHGSWQESRPIFIGWVINATSIVGVMMLASTAPGVARDVCRHRRAVTLLRDNRCGWCGYDIRGLAPEATVCPECGRPMREADVPAG